MSTATHSCFIFRLKSGSGPHFELNEGFNKDLPEDEDNPKYLEIKAGQIVKSKRDLAKLFPNKFELIENVVDVTNQFKGAASLGLVVLYNGTNYKIIETDTGKVLHDSLSGNKEVLDFLKAVVDSK